MSAVSGLAIIVPAFNEEAAIRAGKLAEVAAWLAGGSGNELILVDDGSDDATAELAEPIVDRLVRSPHLGKAGAILTGLRQVSADRVLFTDMDLATPIGEASKLMAALDASADFAIGSRGLVRTGAPPSRYVLSVGQVVLRWLLLRLWIRDTQCGFKAFKRQAVEDVVSRLEVYAGDRRREIGGPSVDSGFDTELLFVARRLGYRIVEVPVRWDHQESPRVRPLRDARNGLVDLLRIAATAARGGYPRRSRS